MKEFEAKTVEEAKNKAAEELGVKVEDLKYEVLAEQKGLFKKYAKIGVCEESDVKDYAAKYLKGILDALNLHADIQPIERDGINHIDMVSDADASRIIGRGGETLQALNELVRSAVYARFGEHYRILLNINGYKDQKYEKLEAMARRIANTVYRTHITAELQPMSSDERRVIHNALNGMENIRTVSIGAGHDRHITIAYVGPDENETEEEAKPDVDINDFIDEHNENFEKEAEKSASEDSASETMETSETETVSDSSEESK